ncbi:MAG: hypothetical protein NTW35_01365 [Candidatus Nomurabacteria bacterium]|nr:hypothetical protein [Candidatus Nomurabacteria bacterium]
MADDIMKDMPLRRVLECVSESYQTAEEIAVIHSRKYPLSLEFILNVSDSLRRKVFDEKETKYKPKSIKSELDILVYGGYIDENITDFFRGELPKETSFYRLNNRGRSAIFSVSKKAKGL